ncbi:hypothetical protein EDB80DRAFT_680965 [Ilyonectria destructans]|nr:hypothetical protein EDB80DRAFT_680965 [Ilyonectria destructans]
MAYYLAAKKRIELVEPCWFPVQCLFLFGVFEMYCLQPLKAWSYFNQASVQFRNLFRQRTHLQTPYNEATASRTRRLEQRLYWSCVKSECKLRRQIPLPPSGIDRLDYPDMLPSPPLELTYPPLHQQGLDVLDDDMGPDEEKSWFYYLAEISSSKIINYAVAAIGSKDEQDWIRNIAKAEEDCEDFERQIEHLVQIELKTVRV